MTDRQPVLLAQLNKTSIIIKRYWISDISFYLTFQFNKNLFIELWNGFLFLAGYREYVGILILVRDYISLY